MNTVLLSGQIWSRELSKWSGKKGGNAATLYVRLVIAPDREQHPRSLIQDKDVQRNVVYKKTQDVGRVWRVGVWVRRRSGELRLCACVATRCDLSVCVPRVCGPRAAGSAHPFVNNTPLYRLQTLVIKVRS